MKGLDELTAIPRGRTTKPYLKLEWTYPVYEPSGRDGASGTAASAPRGPLSRLEALRLIVGDDPRPLLVLRECPVCNKTDDALLKGGTANERTLVLARWFHCVKLPVDVIEPDHPFHALFPDKESEHLFLSLPDGSSRVPLESDGSRTELWSSMSRILGLAYEKNPAGTYVDVLKAFDRIDVLDAKLLELDVCKGLEMESRSCDRRKVEALDRSMAGIRSQIEAEAIEVAKRLAPPPLRARLEDARVSPPPRR